MWISGLHKFIRACVARWSFDRRHIQMRMGYQSSLPCVRTIFVENFFCRKLGQSIFQQNKFSTIKIFDQRKLSFQILFLRPSVNQFLPAATDSYCHLRLYHVQPISKPEKGQFTPAKFEWQTEEKFGKNNTAHPNFPKRLKYSDFYCFYFFHKSYVLDDEEYFVTSLKVSYY